MLAVVAPSPGNAAAAYGAGYAIDAPPTHSAAGAAATAATSKAVAEPRPLG
jgi:hypothetical protein